MNKSRSIIESVIMNNFDDFNEFLERGDDIFVRDREEDTLLHFAAINGRLEFIDLLLAKGLDIHAFNYRGHTPLMAAIEYDRVDSIEHLLKNGDDINFVSEHGDTAFNIAKSFKKQNVVNYIISMSEEKTLSEAIDRNENKPASFSF